MLLLFSIMVAEWMDGWMDGWMTCVASPVGIWCQNDVVSTSMRRDHVALT